MVSDNKLNVQAFLAEDHFVIQQLDTPYHTTVSLIELRYSKVNNN